MFKGDRRILIERRGAESDDGYATTKGEWEVIATVWAEYKPLAAVERLAGMENASFRPARYRIRHDSLWSDLNSADRIDDDGVKYNIKGASRLERGFLIVDVVADGSDNDS